MVKGDQLIIVILTKDVYGYLSRTWRCVSKNIFTLALSYLIASNLFLATAGNSFLSVFHVS
ncbi:hypothetical protein BKA82DRAFT_998545 [Pisolithus tinctorius]|uniref:Uncharacterized protein n=1 Tax=Pisolithus tinctorius Marx 270 TaxID=870435 RepID=A0A0C3P258_PISTI|nr:hypothetical protein BKA82DRAFT_998545 [Pisolithus tinctorius]KIO07125.1 hypothetical protein M404DRAFT_998545 [Pisolithus tinctorius Marx 270]